MKFEVRKNGSYPEDVYEVKLPEKTKKIIYWSFIGTCSAYLAWQFRPSDKNEEQDPQD